MSGLALAVRHSDLSSPAARSIACPGGGGIAEASWVLPALIGVLTALGRARRFVIAWRLLAAAGAVLCLFQDRCHRQRSTPPRLHPCCSGFLASVLPSRCFNNQAAIPERSSCAAHDAAAVRQRPAPLRDGSILGVRCAPSQLSEVEQDVHVQDPFRGRLRACVTISPITVGDRLKSANGTVEGPRRRRCLRGASFDVLVELGNASVALSHGAGNASAAETSGRLPQRFRQSDSSVMRHSVRSANTRSFAVRGDSATRLRVINRPR